jgi:hypothetical protein
MMGIWWVLEGVLYTLKGIRKLEFKISSVAELIEIKFFLEIKSKGGLSFPLTCQGRMVIILDLVGCQIQASWA